MTREDTARAAHRGGTNCAASVYGTYQDVNPGYGRAPAPRSEGGKCGAVLAAEKTLREMGVESDFDARFEAAFGSLKCGELRRKGVPCNDLVGAAARLIEEALG